MEFQSHANQSHFHKNDFALGHLYKGTRKWPILSTALITFLCRTRQNIEHFGWIMDHVQILVLVACFVLLNLAQIADETLLMVCLFLQHQFLRNQAALLMVEHCRRRPA